MSFAGLEIKVSEEQLHEAGDSMMAMALAQQKGITVLQAREMMDLCGSGNLAGSSSGAVTFFDWQTLKKFLRGGPVLDMSWFI